MADNLPPLYEAIENGDVKKVKSLLNGGFFRKACDVNDNQGQGLTPLQRAIQCRKRAVAIAILTFEPNVNAVLNNLTAMDLAEQWGDQKVIKFVSMAGGKTVKELQGGGSTVGARQEAAPSWVTE
jgi:hypothetical protein